MTELLVSALDDAAIWTPLEPDNITPSGELTIADDNNVCRFGGDATSARIEGTTNAVDHRLRWARPALDLTLFDELRLNLHGSVVADGSSERPFILEFRLGSAALSLDAPGNTWRRLLPLTHAHQWQMVRLHLHDLPIAVRSAVTQVQLRCVSAPVHFTYYLDDLIAVREELIGDVDRALLSRLHNQLILDSTPVPAAIVHSGVVEPDPPFIRLVHYGLRRVPHGQQSAERRSDYVLNGYHLLPPSEGYALFYEIAAVAAERSQATAIYEVVIRKLVSNSQLVINNTVHPVELVDFNTQAVDGPERAAALALRFRIYTRQEIGLPQPVQVPFSEIIIHTDYRSSGSIV